MTAIEPAWPNGVRLQTVIRHSTKIYDFFGIPRSQSPTNSGRSLVAEDAGEAPSNAPSSGAAASVAAKMKGQYPAVRLYTRRVQRSFTLLIHACTPLWFTQVPALALLGVALRLLAHARPPLRPGLWFPALLPLSTALYLAALAVCVPVSALSLLRLCLFPRATRRATLGDGNASGFDLGHLASWPAGCALLVAFAAFAVAEGRVRGRAADPLVLAAYACWWLAAAWVAGWAVLVLAMLLSKQSRASSRTPRGRFAPLLGLLDCTTAVATVALAGGLLAWLVLSPGLAAPVVVFSLCAAGSALFLAAFDYAVILHELLLVTGWPPPEITAAVFAMVGPLAQTAAALLVLADAELGDAADSGARTETDLAVMPPMQLVCVLLALLMGGMAVAWLFFGFVICFYHLSRGKLVWSPGWNAAVSPVATLAVLSILLGKHLGGPFFGIAGCVIVVFCLVMFLVNMVFTVQWAVTARRQRDVRAKEDTVAA